MAGCGPGQGKYTVFINGGNANVGYKARMTLFCRGRRGFCTRPSQTTTRITGPGQLLKNIPVSVLDEIAMALNCPSPLRNNWKAVAAELCLNYKTVQRLDNHGPDGKMDGLLQIMFQTKMTVGSLVDILRKVKRPDVIEILVEAGFPQDTRDANTDDESEEELNDVGDKDRRSPLSLKLPINSLKINEICPNKAEANNGTLVMAAAIQTSSRGCTETKTKEGDGINKKYEPCGEIAPVSYGTQVESNTTSQTAQRATQDEPENNSGIHDGIKQLGNDPPIHSRTGEDKQTLDEGQSFGEENAPWKGDDEDTTVTEILAGVKI